MASTPCFQAQARIFRADDAFDQERDLCHLAEFVEQRPFVPQPAVRDPVRVAALPRRPDGSRRQHGARGRGEVLVVRLALVDGSLLVYRDDNRLAAGGLCLIEGLAVVVGALLRVELKPPRTGGRRRDLLHGQGGHIAHDERGVRCGRGAGVRGHLGVGVNNTWRAVGEIVIGKARSMPRNFDAVWTGPVPARARGTRPTQS